MNVGSPLVPNGEPAESANPCQGTFYDPAVPAQAFTRIHSLPRDAAGDTAPPQIASTAGDVAGFISMELFGSSSWCDVPHLE